MSGGNSYEDFLKALELSGIKIISDYKIQKHRRLITKF